MDLKALGEKVISLGAPLLGSVISGSPAGAILAQLLVHAFGGSNDTATILNNITTDPDAKVKIAQIEEDQKIELSKLMMQMAANALTAENTRLDTAAKDTADARRFASESKSITPEILTIVLVVGFFVSIYLVMAIKSDPSDHDVIYMMLGSVSAAFGAVVQFWFGSSASSRVKDYSIKKLSDQGN